MLPHSLRALVAVRRLTGQRNYDGGCSSVG